MLTKINIPSGVFCVLLSCWTLSPPADFQQPLWVSHLPKVSALFSLDSSTFSTLTMSEGMSVRHCCRDSDYPGVVGVVASSTVLAVTFNCTSRVKRRICPALSARLLSHSIRLSSCNCKDSLQIMHYLASNPTVNEWEHCCLLTEVRIR